ncbi:MAG: 16S rRNA (adenine(1518)-N(6)/adenine(1519)-N(6))-dimethyltransferase RsmA [Lachnospiraceae bacterium]|nr:16S rRNA (adenine(1518)-N(6)/adenine(1519)-N(6))-dimethyltransferase RsmA [Lachnospiraceae bacterium]
MAYLSDPKETIAVLQRYHFNFQKKFGQNFLIDGHVIEKIIAAAGIGKDDVVLEIGPGIGTLTQRLCEAAGDVVAVEIDRNLIPILTGDTCKDYKNLRIVSGDIMKTDIPALLAPYGDRPVKVVANLPYYITTPILMKLLEDRLPIESITVMVQKEVAERMETGPGTKDYGALSLAVQYYSEPYLAANVPANCFMPRPNVGSAVIRLTVHDTPPVSVKDERKMFALIRASFNQRRKTLVNGIGNAAELSYTKEQVAEALEKLGMPATIRGEALTLADFAALSDALEE